MGGWRSTGKPAIYVHLPLAGLRERVPNLLALAAWPSLPIRTGLAGGMAVPPNTPVLSANNAEYEARAQRRKSTWKAGTLPAGVGMSEEDVAARLASMAELAEAGWFLLGRALPDYARATMPGRVFRRGTAP